jgi:hypothetical protein
MARPMFRGDAIGCFQPGSGANGLATDWARRAERLKEQEVGSNG